MTAYDAIVIGTGQAGPYVTSRLAGVTSRAAATAPSIIGTLGALRSRLPSKTMEPHLEAAVNE